MSSALHEPGGELGDDDSGQPVRRHVPVGAAAPMPRTVARRSVFDMLRSEEEMTALAGAPKPATAAAALAASQAPAKRGGRMSVLPELDLTKLRPMVMNKPAKPLPPSRKGSRYDELFDSLKPGEMYTLEVAYLAAVRRVMSVRNRVGPQRYSMRTLSKSHFGLWRDR